MNVNKLFYTLFAIDITAGAILAAVFSLTAA
jgi:hypothetical protein